MSGSTQVDFDGGSASLRLTPWDRKALGLQTAEIVRLDAGDAATAARLLAGAEGWAREHGVQYLFGRVEVDNRLVRAAITNAGFAFVECSITLSRSGFGSIPPVPGRMRPTLRPSTNGDIPGLQQIARNDFSHGRFLEDPDIDPGLAANRTANWVGDLVEEGLVFTAESNGRIVGFHAERVDDGRKHADLILTGVAASYAVLGMPLWAVALGSLAERGIESCSTLVSAANTSVLNLYAKLGFRYNTTLFGFRKFL